MDRRRKGPTDFTKWGGADMQPTEPIEGSPTKKPCSHIGFAKTADEQSAAENINITDTAGTIIIPGPIPLYLIPKTISSEIHDHGRNISEIAVRRTIHSGYAITLTTHSPQGEPDAE